MFGELPMVGRRCGATVWQMGGRQWLVSLVLPGLGAAAGSSGGMATATETNAAGSSCAGSVRLDDERRARVSFEVRCTQAQGRFTLLVDRLNKRSKRFPVYRIKSFSRRPDLTG